MPANEHEAPRCYSGSRQLVEIRCQFRPFSIALTRDGSEVICGDQDSNLRHWRVDDGQEIGTLLKTSGRIGRIESSKDGRWIVVADGRSVVVWDARTSEKALEMRQHKGQVNAIDVSADSTKIASGSEDGAAFVTSVAAGKTLLGPLVHNAGVIGIKFSPNGKKIATATPASVRVWDAKTGEKLIDIHVVSVPYPVTPFAWSIDGQYLFAATPGWVTCIDVSTSASLDSWSFPSYGTKLPFLVSNGRFVACCTGTSIYFLDIFSRTQVGPIIKLPAATSCFTLSSDGSCLACGRVDDTISVHTLSDFLPPHLLFDPASCLPLMSLGDVVFESWIKCDLDTAEATLSEEIACSSPTHTALANRALVRTRLCKWNDAIIDAKESLASKPSPIGHIAMALALVGQGQLNLAFRTIDLVFRDSSSHENKFLLLIKAILTFICGKYEDAILRVQDLMVAADDIVTHCCAQVLANMYLIQGDYERAVQTFKDGPSNAFSPAEGHLDAITLIFGWTLQGLGITIHQRLSEFLYNEKRIGEGAECLLKTIHNFGKEIRANPANADWINDLTKKYATALESIGDGAILGKKYDDAIVQYSSALSLDPPSKANILIKRSKARAEKRLWQEALDDANMAIDEDPSCPWGHARRHSALHGMQRYDEAIESFRNMLSSIEESPNPKIREKRKDYVSPELTIRAIDDSIRQILRTCPLVLIDVTSGRLCGTAEQVRMFKADVAFKELVSSTTVKLDKERISRVVTKYFQYVMFSHVWEGKEPLFQDVNAVGSVWDLDLSPLNGKLRKFCEVVQAGEENYRWAWSDTCCIDKTTSTMLNESLMSMYKWYEDSAETLVYLSCVGPQFSFGDLPKSIWMTRLWTLQELLAPKVVRFYDRNWQPYLNETRRNHKESVKIMQELASAIQLSPATIVTFRPNDLSVREKLRLASTRHATLEEDEAYALIGIFSSDIRPHYGEREAALGHLLEEIVSRSGEVTALAWTGRSSTYNSCLPASLAVYSRAPFTISTMEAVDAARRVEELRGVVSTHSAKAIYKRIARLPLARFTSRRLYLPCIVFPVQRLGVQQLANSHSQGNRYLAKISGLGKVEFSTADLLPLQEPRKVLCVHPWIRDVRGGDGGSLWADEPDSDSEADQATVVDSSSDTSDLETPSMPLSAVPSADVDDLTRALLMIVRLCQPFSALLLLEQPDGSFKRVASENDIVVQIQQSVVSLKDVRAKVVEVR